MQVDARKRTLGKKEALDLLRSADELYASKGKKVIHVNLKTEKPDLNTLAPLLLGPTGNLRAPTLRKGRILLVGFDEVTYRKIFG